MSLKITTCQKSQCECFGGWSGETLKKEYFDALESQKQAEFAFKRKRRVISSSAISRRVEPGKGGGLIQFDVCTSKVLRCNMRARCRLFGKDLNLPA